uniref:ODAD1 central coiled coil region domain-containing protein n=1 Tax=Pyramimonas obovata TaxID=1411642 RepID=A0A7S0WV22_9CHLO|mmetsp:Transcript_4227/g.8717  ORF Transcript_4227/g.8717 Transcript_4227/m.8717 type:complete len:544 (+) Transcript_4227:268-1899(+)
MSKLAWEAKGETDGQLTDMHRKYRIMEGNRKNYAEDSVSIIKRQRSTIEKVKRDNEGLRREIAGLGKGNYQMLDANDRKHIREAQNQADYYARKIELERRRDHELTSQLKLAESKMLEKKRALGGVNATREDDQQVNRQIKVLEARLDKALLNFNEALAHNKVMREEIDDLRRERVIFEQIYKKLSKDLHDKKVQMVNVIEISNIAYEARDQAQNEIAALCAQSDKEQVQFEVEMRELDRLIEREVRITEEVKKAQLAKQLEHFEQLANPEFNKPKEKERVYTVPGASRGPALGITDRVQVYDDAFAKIQAATGMSDMDQLVSSFINAEDQNFSLFNFANELNQDLERLEEAVSELQAEYAAMTGADSASEGQRQQVLADLNTQVQDLQHKSDAYESKFASSMGKMDGLIAVVGRCFHKLGCVKPEEGGDRIREDNLLLYLGAVEQRGNTLLQIKSAQGVYKPAEKAELAVLGHGPGAPVGSSTVEVPYMPSTAQEHNSDGESDEDECDDRPLTRDELQAKTFKNIGKKEKLLGKHRSRKAQK